jgi:PAS domain S-box-containing protein
MSEDSSEPTVAAGDTSPEHTPRAREREEDEPTALVGAGVRSARLAEGAGTPSEKHLLTLLDSAPILVFLKDVRSRYVFINKYFERFGTMTADQVVGLTDHDFRPLEVAEKLRVDEEQVMSTRAALEYEEYIMTEVGPRYFRTVKYPVFDAQGELFGVGGFVTNITEQKRIEAERLAEQQRVIAAQETTLRELSTPLLPIAEGILAMPLIGTIDSLRAREILEALLRGITEQRARVAILDVTGIHLMDGEVANAIVGAARAARLLGARVVLTGISPAVAQTLVTLGADLSDVTVLATLASGIAFAIKS